MIVNFDSAGGRGEHEVGRTKVHHVTLLSALKTGLRRAATMVAFSVLASFPSISGAVTFEEQFRALCAKSAGNVVRRTIPNVEGILWNGLRTDKGIYRRGCRDLCLRLLFWEGFRFFESESPIAPDSDGPEIRNGHLVALPSLTDGPGLYRFALERRGHPNCRLFEEKTRPLLVREWRPYKLWRAPLTTEEIEQIDRRLAAVCIASQRIQVPKAQFSYTENAILTVHGIFSVKHNASAIEDRTSGETIATFNDYLLYRSNNHFGDCGGGREPFRVWQVLIPPKKYEK